MRHDFKTEFLVCLDLSQDVNYVVGRSPNMEGARDIARKARNIFPDDKVYITKEMVLRQSLGQLSPAGRITPLRQKVAANPEPKTNKCKCGKKEGQCVGSLGCQCNPIAMCKKADKWETNPISESLEDDDDEMDDFAVEEDIEFEDDEESEDDEEYASNPEELEEEDLEEEYETNPDEEDEEDEDDEDGDEDEDEDYQNNPDDDDDDDNDDDDDDDQDEEDD